jgi:hypothetical protein
MPVTHDQTTTEGDGDEFASRVRDATDEDIARLGRLVIGPVVRPTGPPPDWVREMLEQSELEPRDDRKEG